MNASVPARGSILKAGLMGGAVAALFHATPYITKLNTCCCALTVVAGIFAAWILQVDSERRASAGGCGIAGAVAGLVGGFVGVPLAGLVSRLAFGTGPLEAQVATTIAQVRQLMETWGTAPGSEQIAESVLRASVGLEFSGWTIFVALMTGMIFSFFGLLGGLLGGVLMRPTPPGRPTGPVPPPPRRAPLSPPPPPSPAVVDAEPPPVPAPTGDELPLDDERVGQGPLAHDELPLLPARSEPADEPRSASDEPASPEGRDSSQGH